MILTVTLNAAIDKRYVVDDYKVGEVNRVRECSYVPGGKGLNVSKPASIYGAEVVATGFVGGHAGNYIEDALKPFGIKGEFYHVDAESRSCINIWDEVNHVQTEFLEPGFTLTEADFEGFEKKFRELVKDASVVAMSGSVPKGLDGTAYQRLVKIVKDAGKPVILDTSGKLLEEGIKAAPTLIKPNIDEIRMLTGKHCDDINDIIEAARLDGLSETGIFFRMYMPTMKSTYAAATIITFMNAWNNYLWPKVILQNNESITMPMLVANLLGGYTVDYGVLMLGVFICTIPTAIIFFCFQKSFTEGITGAVK